MRFISAFTSVVAIMAFGARAAVFPPRQNLDVCAFVGDFVVVDAFGVSQDFGALELCLCLSALPLFLTTNLVAIAAVEADGIGSVTDVLTALINGGSPCTPSASSKAKRDSYLLDDNVCPKGLSLCGVQSSWSRTAWECVDTQRDLESCGGCSVGILGTAASGTDCTSIEGVDEVACSRGKCQVNTCRSGYEVSECGTMCKRVGGKALAHHIH